MGNDLFDLVLKAQAGDKEALEEIITMFTPVINSARYKTKPDRQDDLEQKIVETIIKKILMYDLAQTPDFSAFCRQLQELQLNRTTSQEARFE
ncbi:helix-turn-helix domain-containing protein [Cohnella endophytica]|uniref:Helix-turn-helix domain-containing protein n=1 Tax=Cohnella endophytica TaxID=2419778 RepID=A0A494XTA9_9BACL|nr:helix-turn-helix domain-containing protein [Cohnella endophytica]RKP51329.1 helix-turn-helix domain-containing protein [Cohnella endophytica]